MGDLRRLGVEIARKHERGKLTNDEARDLARTVAEREIVSAKDERTALDRLREARACAAELDDAFERRMKTRDGAGAEAARALLEDGKLSESDAREWLGDADDRWRAVGVQTLHREEDGMRRRAAMLDPSPRVRRGALRASARAGDATDLDLLFETARLDPDLLLRNEALRSMSTIVRSSVRSSVEDVAAARARELVSRLRDLFATGDDAIKEDVAVAWGLAPVFDHGGRDALHVVIASGKGPGAVAAAGVVMRSIPNDAELTSSAAALLSRTITDGSRRDRLHAIAVVVRVDGPILDAIRKAAEDDDLDIKVPALARLLESKPDREKAKRELYAIAGYGVKGSGGADLRAIDRAERARYALATAGELRVQAWLEEDLSSADPQRKTASAVALAALGRPARAAPLLADPDPSVRTRVACTMMMATRR